MLTYPKKNLPRKEGIPKSEIVHGPARIDEILAPVSETLKHGGYIPFSDHFVPPEVDWKNYCCFREKLHAMMDKAASGASAPSDTRAVPGWGTTR